MIELFIILLSGFSLYALLKPPAQLEEQPAANNALYAEMTVSNVNSTDTSMPSERALPIVPKEEE